VPDGGHAPRGAPVPVEFLGAARRFRERILAVDALAIDAMEVILAPVRRRLEKKRNLRSAMVIDTAREWREKVPAEFRLSLDVIYREHSVAITEVRISSSRTKHIAWGGTGEPGISIARVELAAGNGRLTVDTRPLASISLHALARRYQRGGCDEAAISRDLRDIVAVGVTGSDDVRCRTGLWAGPVIAVRDGHDPGGRIIRMRDVRTYVDDEMIPDGRPWRDLAELRVERALAG